MALVASYVPPLIDPLPRPELIGGRGNFLSTRRASCVFADGADLKHRKARLFWQTARGVDQRRSEWRHARFALTARRLSVPGGKET